MLPDPFPTGPGIPPENRRFARVVERGTQLVLTWLVVSHLAYLAAPPAGVAAHWQHSHGEFHAATGLPVGWAQLADLPAPGALSLAGIALLGLLPPLALLTVLPLYWRRRERLFSAVVVTTTVVILLAASGWIASGH
ncbi:MAG: hypothetical protein IT204_20065 [Fimbriimonadaceae bacterium]|nr:hypothetical protein [Fimbriimonadaceae bacterium]